MKSRSTSKRLFRVLVFTLLVASTFATASLHGAINQERYFPPLGTWEERTPEQQGMDSSLLQAAIEHALSNQNDGDRDLAVWLREQTGFGNEPFFETYGPTTQRAAMSGLVIRNGYVVAEWGETRKVDMTFSVSKSFLSTVVGLAWDRGMIRDVHEPVVGYMPTDELFASEHNRKITWDHMLRQTSDWRGMLFEMPAWADRPARRNVEGGPATYADIQNVPLSEPGTAYEYNDVRVNLLALVALNVWRRPLPQVLREYVMDPIGASNTWRWYGYRNSWVMVDGQNVQSVSGGGHWGGGMHISARDMARFGYLFSNDGVWDGERIISEDWIAMARTPGTAEPARQHRRYGFMNWGLNTPLPGADGQMQKAIAGAPENAVRFSGAGSNLIYFDQENDLVVVVRWISGGANEFFDKVIAAIKN